jgi:hypothetical protein
LQATLDVVRRHEWPEEFLSLIIVVPSSLPNVALAKSEGLGVTKHNHCEGANTMIMERGARPDALPYPKRSRTTLAVIVALGVGLALGFGAGVGLSKHWAQGSAGPRPRAALAVPDVGEARDRWRCNSVSEYDDVPTSEELEWIAVRWRARYAEPKWGTP